MVKNGHHQPARHQNKYATLAAPQEELDFHLRGVLTEAEIVRATREFIASSVARGLKKVLIITGKGLHSRDGVAVVKPVVERTLRGDDHVLGFSNARRDRGGDGAIEVNLQKN